jgi:pyruvate dehydrogenase E2 component (dihydrolipoamide acetyltransferase)
MNIVMPKLGLTMTEATLARWRKAEGEQVSQGEILFEFERDKSLMEYECPAYGVMGQILVAEGETVPCGTPVATLETTFEPGDRDEGAQGSKEARGQGSGGAAEQARVTEMESQRANELTPQPSNSILATPAAKRRARELEVALAGISGRGPDGRIQLVDVEAVAKLKSQNMPPATPMAKRLATDLTVDLTQVTGSGSGGRIVKDDILQVAQQPPSEIRAFDSRPLAGVRQIIAQRMSDSAFTAPHVTLFTEADATALVDARQQINAELGGTIKISYNTLLTAIVARVLRGQPHLNAALVDGEIRHYHHVNIALAVDTERGLLVPVIRDADKLTLIEIQTHGEALIDRALNGKSLPDDLTSGTFTITNLGMFDIDGFTPIINPPQAAILGVGRIVAKPVVVEGQVVVRQMMSLSLSFDHRLVDGGPAARFLQRIKQLVERPFALLVNV